MLALQRDLPSLGSLSAKCQAINFILQRCSLNFNYIKHDAVIMTAHFMVLICSPVSKQCRRIGKLGILFLSNIHHYFCIKYGFLLCCLGLAGCLWPIFSSVNSIAVPTSPCTLPSLYHLDSPWQYKQRKHMTIHIFSNLIAVRIQHFHCLQLENYLEVNTEEPKSMMWKLKIPSLLFICNLMVLCSLPFFLNSNL